ncbi:LuxR C-terminal-related transcriptional regulator [Paenibacillus elgii]|uniref:LuxR C-terminal-related transcriptional regulator n=1 Tax=Paenibacillus elgii TaxID=189691 RepID=UPI000FDB713E|nr:LuxR C-terminal-related transcriptional regulator [Paenibacillus elgii]NEN82500.1 LuxR family transcriptional regulator [Paenibacillus elgii]
MIRYSEPVVLKSKISPPLTRETLVARDRLLHKISKGMKGRLTTVCAPPGFGKTTLLCQWVRHNEQAAAWVSLDERDNDLARFWRYVVHAVDAAIIPGFAELMAPVLHTLPQGSVDTVIDVMMNELHSLDRPAALILDDYHCLYDKSIHESVSYMIDILPDNMHLLIASRTELPFSTAKWLVRDERTDIPAPHMLFTSEEAEIFYREVVNLPLSADHIAKVLGVTEGWAAGLQLVSLSLQERPDYERLVQDFSGTDLNIADYLFHEVLSRLSAELYEFVLQTSVLQRMDASICDTVTLRGDSRLLLERLRSRNLFVVALDNGHTWFRYHHVFSEFLRTRLRHEQPQQWTRLNRLASLGFAERGLFDDAIDHAIAAEDYALASGLLDKHILTVLLRGEFATLLSWFACFPARTAWPSQLHLLYAFLLIVTGQFERAEDEMRTVEIRLANGEYAPEIRDSVRSGLFFVKANLMFSSGRYEQWYAFAERMNELLPEDPVFYNFNFNESEPLVRRTAFGLKGALSDEAGKIGRRFVQMLEARGWKESLINQYVVQTLAESMYEWNCLEESRQLSEQVEKVSRAKRIPGLFVPNRITQARIDIAEGRLSLAGETMDEAIDFASRHAEYYWVRPLRAFRARIHLLQGQIDEAAGQIALLQLPLDRKPTYNREIEVLSATRLLGALGKEDEALRLLEQLKPQGRREGCLISMIEIPIQQALMEQRRGQSGQALDFLHEALSVAEPYTYIRSFVDEGPAMARLLQQYVARRSASELETRLTAYAGKLLGWFPQPDDPPAVPSSAGLVEALTPSEWRMLNGIRQGASNKQIALEHALSEGTVKVYLSRIYGKLGVSSRTQALLRAQELGLFDRQDSSGLNSE